MNDIIKLVCCCFFPIQTSNQQTDGRNNNLPKNPQKDKKYSKPSRIKSKYRQQQVIQIYKDEKKLGIPAYTCPICTLFFNKILACDNCENLMCFKCIKTYQQRYEKLSSQNMKCPFCNSQKSNFKDYEKHEKKYFDSTQTKKQSPTNDRDSKKISDVEKKNDLIGQYHTCQVHGQKKKQHSSQIGNLSTGRQQTHLEQIHIQNPGERGSFKFSEEETSQTQILPIAFENSVNTNTNDLEFIDQFELRTVEDISVE